MEQSHARRSAALSAEPAVEEAEQRRMALPARAGQIVEYRKSGLSLNHVQGCPLDCAYCIRHTYGLWDHRQPRPMMTDQEAVHQLVSHRYFARDVTPIQLFNRATDPFLPAVRDHTFSVLGELDRRGLRNHVLVITRCPIRSEDCVQLSSHRNIKITLLFTYSGIDDRRIEPYPSEVAAESLATASAMAGRSYRTVLYWRPLVPGLNDSPAHLVRAVELSMVGDATVFTGLFFRDEIAAYYREAGLPAPYEQTARRKVVPETLEERVLEAFRQHVGGPLFRKTSCAVSFAHNLPDYNGHVGIRELCDICPARQLRRCLSAHQMPTTDKVLQTAAPLPEARGLRIVDISERAAVVTGLPTEESRYFLQHTLGFQVHDVRHPHQPGRHGRAEIGWDGS